MSDRTSIRVTDIQQLTPDVRRYRCEKPDDYEYQPGQATEVALDVDGMRDETRPFTFTSLPEADHLEFVIKSYPDHDGVTEQIGQIEVGASLLIGDAWGAITDQGPGTFIAGGAGVTPFIAILRARRASGNLDGCHLVFSNATEADIILRGEFEDMPALQTTFIVTDQPESPLSGPRLDRTTLADVIDPSDRFYLCGPPPMMDDLTAALDDLGANADKVITEDL